MINKIKKCFYVTRTGTIMVTMITAMFIMWCYLICEMNNDVIKALAVIGIMISGIMLQNMIEMLIKSLKEDIKKVN